MSVLPGVVDWSGENPGMYLKENSDGPYSSLASFFRVVVSPHGAGHAAFVLMGDTNVCITDNEALGRYLEEGFIANFGSFKGHPALGKLTYRKADRFSHEGSHTTQWKEIATGPGVSLELTWSGLYDTFALDVPAERSATGKHRMLSLFVSAREGTISLNGVRGAGKPHPRNAHGRDSSSAFLAFSETWIRA